MQSTKTTENGPFSGFISRHLSLLLGVLFLVYMSFVWLVNIPHIKVINWVLSVGGGVFFFLFVFLYVMNLKPVYHDKKIIRFLVCTALLVIMLFSISIRQATYISIMRWEMRGGMANTFIGAVIKKVGKPATVSTKNMVYTKYVYSPLGSIMDGAFTGFYGNGVKLSEGTYRNNCLTGQYRLWYENGKEYLTADFKNNSPNGLVHVSNAAGIRWSEGFFERGKPVGEWTYYTEENKDGIKGPFELEKAFNLSGKSDVKYKLISDLFSKK